MCERKKTLELSPRLMQLLGLIDLICPNRKKKQKQKESCPLSSRLQSEVTGYFQNNSATGTFATFFKPNRYASF